MERHSVVIIGLGEIQDRVRNGDFSENITTMYLEWCETMEGSPIPWGRILTGFNHLLGLKEGEYLWIID
ncbi:hypothetical protein FDJ20_gp109 [Vibrio phage Thalassa]|uniref:Uncharacterized protein n=1 Tax=Vibrio phage Thalassa TaxID=2570301 RepID=A0A2H5BHE2_9CAUD|nr:hypothetical protein FDJ20_gp002 [Vibrio phage Thalassa]YP_009621474.1 hypothetical protein FDJ20_gp109 [Vibrio phage Thalassa]AUG85204.1 hypothetical protein THALASSA_2 [Vibrio phage Thalassa]AUG85393.1 hypothetical protein THALASSA_214 [Vibrio phage Thalassa]